MKKIIFTTISSILCFSFLVGCTKNSDDKNNDKEVDYITMDSFNQDDQDTSTTEEGLLATIYITDDNALNLIEKKVTLSAITPEDILTELKTYQSIPENTEIKEFKTYNSDDNFTVGIINFSKNFYDFNLGSGFESMMLNSIAKTYIENFELDKFKILVDGDEYQSGHILFEKEDYFTPKDFN